MPRRPVPSDVIIDLPLFQMSWSIIVWRVTYYHAIARTVIPIYEYNHFVWRSKVAQRRRAREKKNHLSAQEAAAPTLHRRYTYIIKYIIVHNNIRTSVGLWFDSFTNNTVFLFYCSQQYLVWKMSLISTAN